MTVTELLAELQSIEDKGRVVILQHDEEGSGFSPANRGYKAAYQPETGEYGQVGLEKLDNTAVALGYDESDVIRGGQPAYVLSPEI